MDSETTWVCNICGHRNQDNEDVCEQCGSFSQESSYDAIADEENQNG